MKTKSRKSEGQEHVKHKPLPGGWGPLPENSERDLSEETSFKNKCEGLKRAQK